jgi:hypothetical protein
MSYVLCLMSYVLLCLKIYMLTSPSNHPLADQLANIRVEIKQPEIREAELRAQLLAAGRRPRPLPSRPQKLCPVSLAHPAAVL